jgi:hypothetical protein
MADRAARSLRRDLERLEREHGVGPPLRWLDRPQDRDDARAAYDVAMAALAVRTARRRLADACRLRTTEVARREAALGCELDALAEGQDAHDRRRLAAGLTRLRDEACRWTKVAELHAEVERLERHPERDTGSHAPWWHGERGQAALRHLLRRDQPPPPEIPAGALARARLEVALAVALARSLSPDEHERGWGRVAVTHRELVQRRSRLRASELAGALTELEAAGTLASALAGAVEEAASRPLAAALTAAGQLIEVKERALWTLASDLQVLDAEQRLDDAWRRALEERGRPSPALDQAAAAREQLREASADALSAALLGAGDARAALRSASAALADALRSACGEHLGHQRRSRAVRPPAERTPGLRAIVGAWRRVRDLDVACDGPDRPLLDAQRTRARAAADQRLGPLADPARLAAAWLRFWRLGELGDAVADLERDGEAARVAAREALRELLADPARAAGRPALAAAQADAARARREHDATVAAATRDALLATAELRGLERQASERVRALGLVGAILGGR